MARKRWLSTNVSNDRRVAELARRAGLGAALLYTWCIPHAGDDARLTNDPEELLSQVAPLLAMRGLVTIDDVQSLREHALSLGLLEDDGQHLRFPPGAFYGYQSYIEHPRRTETHHSAPEHTDSHRNAPFVNSSSSSYSSSYLDRYADATLSARAGAPAARADFSQKLCSACKTTLPRRAPKHGLCADCHGKALVAARAANVDATHISLEQLADLARA